MPNTVLYFACFFFIYSFAGWCAEVVYAAVCYDGFVNRGFLCGPVCPIYGCGMLAVLLALEPLRGNIALLFAGSVAVATVIEYAVGVLAKAVFHQQLWDYTDEKFNFKGYICLKFSLFWGLGALAMVQFVHPLLLKLISFAPVWLLTSFIALAATLMVIDLALTLTEVLKIPRKLKAIDELERLFTGASTGIGSNLSVGTLKLEKLSAPRRAELAAKLKHYKDLLNDYGKTGRRLVKAFPRLRKAAYVQGIERVKALYNEWREKL